MPKKDTPDNRIDNKNRDHQGHGGTPTSALNIDEFKKLTRDLAKLAKDPEYAHAIAALSFHSHYVMIHDSFTEKKYAESEDKREALRQEISVLIYNFYLSGCMINHKIQSHANVQSLIDKSKEKLRKIHDVYVDAFHDEFNARESDNDFWLSFSSMSEVIFYDADCGSATQLHSLSIQKYMGHNDWFVKNKFFTVQDMNKVINYVSGFINKKVNDFFQIDPKKGINKLNSFGLLPFFTFSDTDISKFSGMDIEVVKKVINTFCINYQKNIKNTPMERIDEFNPINSYPILEIGEGEYVCFQISSLQRAAYETPDYWMGEDEQYLPCFNERKGKFAEDIVCDQLKAIFGENNVHQNLTIYRGKNKVGEIDVLVKWGSILCVFEVKSKKLTITARMGDATSIKSDFEKSVQQSYNQAYKTADLLLSSECILVSSDGISPQMPNEIKEIYLFPVVTECYPGLLYMQNKMLEIKSTHASIIKAPYVIDVFFLHAMSNILEYPLYFFDFVTKRLELRKNIMWSSHESVILGCYLKGILLDMYIQQTEDPGCIFYVDPKYVLEIDLILKKNEGVDYPIETSDTFFDRMDKNPMYRNVISSMLQSDDYDIIKIGIILLSMDENFIAQVSQIIDTALKKENNGKFFSVITKCGKCLSIMYTGGDKTKYKQKIESIAANYKRDFGLQLYCFLGISRSGKAKFGVIF